ncbi:MAG: type II toxin-antitoxin system Phd/YefM family antitoxin [Chloroflexota bacterium]
MSKQVSIAEARNHFTALVHEVEQHSSVELTRRGKPVAVLLSIQEYRHLTSHRSGFWEMYSTFQSQVNLADLNISPDVFADVREESQGREVSW